MDDSMIIKDVFSKYTGTYTKNENIEEEESNSYMNFDSYLKLMVAQMQNQDFNDPMDDSEVLAQMAQYSMLEGIKTMTQQSNISYATSLVGKVVTVNGTDGLYTGKVESITVSNGKVKLMIDGGAYDSDKVTDIVSEDIFNALMTFIGKTVKDKNADPEKAVTGKVTNILFMGGEGYVAVNGKLISLSKIEVVPDSAETGSDENGGAAEEGSEDDGDTVTESAEVQTAESMSTYSAKTQSLIEQYMKELDSVGGVSGVSSESPAETYTLDNYTVETVELEVPDYAAGVYGDNEVLTRTVSADGTDKTFASGNGTLSRDYSSIPLASSQSSYYYINPETAERTATGKLKGVTAPRGVTKGDDVPRRISVEDYPEEAQLADDLGTRMYDIRFINNRAITSRIKTDEVIGHTAGGKAVTEIGFSGVGQLGEVVTFADGTQRVEILLKSGKSAWFTTSGNLTLDEICTKNGAPGSLAGKLTPSESAIRHFSDPASEAGKAIRNSFKRYITNSI